MGDQIQKRSFKNTHLALDQFHAGKAERDDAWAKSFTHADVDACHAADTAALRIVQRAFHFDTQDINSVDNCYRISVQDIVRMTDWTKESQ